jgi:glycosyltransferase involved in cell wall biosynthesis
MEMNYAYRVQPHAASKRLMAGAALGLTPSTSALVVFGYASWFSLGALLGARIRGVPVFTQSDSSYLQQVGKNRCRKKVKQWVLQLLMSRDARVWVVGPDNARYWADLGFENQTSVPFESPVPASQAVEKEATELRSELGLRPHTKVALFVGRLAPEKGLDDALTAISSLTAEGDDLDFVVVGKGDDYTGIRGDAAVLFVGAVTHQRLGAYYRMADVLIVPSLREPYGLVVREALQFGTPVVATEVVTSARELCDYGWNIVPPSSPRLLAAAVRRACQEDRWPRRPPLDVSAFYRQELAAFLA